MKPNNPFYHRGPIQDPRFFWNRREEVEQARLLLGQGQSVSIVGPRRIGKSSLLRHLSDGSLDADDDDRYVYVNCEGWSAASPASLFALLLEAIGKNAPATNDSLDYRSFRAGVLNAIPDGERLILLLDEFESLAANPGLDAAFFSGLRALASAGQVVFITASARSLGWLTFAEPTALSSPFFNIFTQIVLRPFTPCAAAEMLEHFAARSGHPFAGSAVAFVLSLSGPHPFYAQIGAFYAFAQTGQDGALDSNGQTAVRREFLAQVHAHWRYAWGELRPADHKQLALSTNLADCSEWLRQRLRAQALVVDEATGPRLLSPELEHFFSRQPVDGLLQAPPLVIDEGQRRAVLAGQPLDVSGLEYALLHLLGQQAGEVIPLTAIQAALWSQDDGKADNGERLKSVVKTLRRKLGAHSHLLQNVRGVGYTIAAEPIDKV